MFPALEEIVLFYGARIFCAQGSCPSKQTTACAGVSWTASHCPVEIGILGIGASVNANTLAAAVDTSNKVLCF